MPTAIQHRLTEKQEAFCIEYVLNKGNAAAAARRAGYCESSDEQEGYRLLRNAYIIARIAKLREDAGTKTGANIEWAESLLVETAERCSQRIPVLDPEGNETGEWKFDARGVSLAISTLSKLKGWEKTPTPEPISPPEEQIARKKRRMAELLGEEPEA